MCLAFCGHTLFLLCQGRDLFLRIEFILLRHKNFFEIGYTSRDEDVVPLNKLFDVAVVNAVAVVVRDYFGKIVVQFSFFFSAA